MAFLKKWLIFPFMGVMIFFCCSANGVPNEKKVRPYLTTGAWYPASPAELQGVLDSFFKKTTVKTFPGKIRGLISPHAGLAYSGQNAANGYAQLTNLGDINRVILLGVAHRASFYGAAVGDFTQESTPLGLMTVDTDITAKLGKESLFKKDNDLLQNEHSLENQLPLLQYMMKAQKNTSYKIVPILFGYLEEKDIKKAATIIKKYVTDHTLIVASSDFTHYGENYGYTPFKNDIKNNLTTLDMGMIEKIIGLDCDGYRGYKNKTGITMCGFIPVGVLMHILEKEDNEGTLINYYKSADSSKDYSMSVSYAAIVFSQRNETKKETGNKINEKTKREKKMTTNTKNDGLTLSRKEEETLLKLARQTLEEYFQGKKEGLNDLEKKNEFTEGLKEKAGVFVTLREGGALRGCIGSIIGTEPLWQGVFNNALNSALHDPRFNAVVKSELKKIDIEISVMTPLQEITDYKTIRLGIDGVIIRKGPYQSVFLPQVATETGWNLDEFLSHLCMKAGLPSKAYQSEGMEFMIFQAQVFGEKEE